MRLNLLNKSYPDEARDISVAKLTNMYLDIEKHDGRITPKAAKSCAGTKSVVELSTVNNSGTVRGMLEVDDRLFAVRSNEFLELTYDADTDTASSEIRGTMTFVADQLPFGRVYMAASHSQILITDGTDKGYVFDYTDNSFVEITDTEWEGGVTCVFLSGFFITHVPDTATLHASVVNNATSWQALDIATAESAVDDIIGLAVVNNELWVFGQKTIEIWVVPQPVPESEFPLIRANIVIDIGCGARGSIVASNNTVAWLSDKRQVLTATGYKPMPISDTAHDYQLAHFTTIDDASSYVYYQDGHWFYYITFPSQDVSWCYDAVSNTWLDRVSRNPSTGTLHCHNSLVHAVVNGRDFVGDGVTGTIYRMSSDIYEDAGDSLYRELITPHTSYLQKNINMLELVVNFQTRIGNLSGVGSEPKIAMQYSLDSGYTWSSLLIQPLGKFGQFIDKISWYCLGLGRLWTFKFIYYDNTPFTIIDIAGNVKVHKT